MSSSWQDLYKFRCTGCGDCCRETIVLVTDRDVRRIMRHTGQAAEDIVHFYKPADIEWSTDNPGWIRLKPGMRIMGLHRTETGCQYLSEDDRCTIYEHRPVTCRRYPFNVEFDADGNIELLSISNAVDCPYELDGHNTPAQITTLCDWEEAEETPYNKKIKAWNKRKNPGGQRRFMEYLGF